MRLHRHNPFDQTLKDIFCRQHKDDIDTLKDHGGPKTAQLTYQLAYIGSLWSRNGSSLPGLRQKLDDALKAAMTSGVGQNELNGFLLDYFPDQAVSATALASTVIACEWPEFIDAAKLEAFAENFTQQPSLNTFGLLFVLPPGTILKWKSADARLNNSMEGLGGFHGATTFPDGKVVSSAVVVWSDGENGTAVPGQTPPWEPWENTCAAAYHELVDLRTSPATTIGKPAWAADDGTGIAQIAVEWAGTEPQKVFRKIPIGSVTVPVQLPWSKSNNRPWMVGANVPGYCA